MVQFLVMYKKNKYFTAILIQRDKLSGLINNKNKIYMWCRWYFDVHVVMS